jgi:hypothetical protein
VPLDTAFSRRWYRPAREPLPAEPGRLVVAALLARARCARGCTTPGDDRIETRVYAVKRYLFRLGHASRSARYATSIAQLVVGLAPVMGWGPVPRDGAERARFVRAHRRSVQRWLDDLAAAGLAAHEPERDARGCWWRTQIVLLAAPSPTAAELGSRRAAPVAGVCATELAAVVFVARRVSVRSGHAAAFLLGVSGRAFRSAPACRRTRHVAAPRSKPRSPRRRASEI